MDNLPSDFRLMVPSKRKVNTDYGQDGGFTAGEPNHKKPCYNPDIANSKSAKSKSNQSNIDSDCNYSNNNENRKVVQHNVVNGNVINGNIVNGRIMNGKIENGSDKSCDYEDRNTRKGRTIFMKKKKGTISNLSDISSNDGDNNYFFGCGSASYGKGGKNPSRSKIKSRHKAQKKPSSFKTIGGAVSKNVQPYDNDTVAMELKENIALSQQKKHELKKLHTSLSEKVSDLRIF